MTFEPGGDARIPNQIGPSGRKRGGRPEPGSPRAFTVAIVQVGVVNAVLLTAAIVATYALELVDPQTGVWLVLGAALVGGVLMMVVLVGHQRRRAQYARSPQGRTATGSPTSPAQQQDGPPAQHPYGRASHNEE